jgi:hypothetical protein
LKALGSEFAYMTSIFCMIVMYCPAVHAGSVTVSIVGIGSSRSYQKAIATMKVADLASCPAASCGGLSIGSISDSSSRGGSRNGNKDANISDVPALAEPRPKRPTSLKAPVMPSKPVSSPTISPPAVSRKFPAPAMNKAVPPTVPTKVTKPTVTLPLKAKPSVGGASQKDALRLSPPAVAKKKIAS